VGKAKEMGTTDIAGQAAGQVNPLEKGSGSLEDVAETHKPLPTGAAQNRY